MKPRDCTKFTQIRTGFHFLLITKIQPCDNLCNLWLKSFIFNGNFLIYLKLNLPFFIPTLMVVPSFKLPLNISSERGFSR